MYLGKVVRRVHVRPEPLGVAVPAGTDPRPEAQAAAPAPDAQSATDHPSSVVRAWFRALRRLAKAKT